MLCSDEGLQLDSDDLLEATALEKCFWFLESHPEYQLLLEISYIIIQYTDSLNK